jgi:hypothetical protein
MSSETSAAANPPLLCIGHSHLHCVQRASVETGIAIDAINFWDDNSVVRDYPDNPTLIPDLQQRFRDHAGTIFSFIGGGAHSVVGLVSHPRRIDFVLPEAPTLALDPRAEILPVAAVRAMLVEQIQPYLKLMRHVSSLAQRRVVHMEPPPPCGDSERMLRYIPWSLFPGMLKEIAPRPLHYKLWRLHSEIVASHCAELGMDFDVYPSQAIGADGFLLPEFFHDGVHGNNSYGALLLRRMQELA